MMIIFLCSSASLWNNYAIIVMGLSKSTKMSEEEKAGKKEEGEFFDSLKEVHQWAAAILLQKA